MWTNDIYRLETINTSYERKFEIPQIPSEFARCFLFFIANLMYFRLTRKKMGRRWNGKLRAAECTCVKLCRPQYGSIFGINCTLNLLLSFIDLFLFKKKTKLGTIKSIVALSWSACNIQEFAQEGINNCHLGKFKRLLVWVMTKVGS